MGNTDFHSKKEKTGFPGDGHEPKKGHKRLLKRLPPRNKRPSISSQTMTEGVVHVLVIPSKRTALGKI